MCAFPQGKAGSQHSTSLNYRHCSGIFLLSSDVEGEVMTFDKFLCENRTEVTLKKNKRRLGSLSLPEDVSKDEEKRVKKV